MIFGITTFTLIHVVLSLVGISPTQREPPFLATQLVVLALFVWLGRAAMKGFRAEPAAMVG